MSSAVRHSRLNTMQWLKNPGKCLHDFSQSALSLMFESIPQALTILLSVTSPRQRPRHVARNDNTAYEKRNRKYQGFLECQLVVNNESLLLPDTERATVLQSLISADPEEDLRANHENLRSTDWDLLVSSGDFPSSLSSLWRIASAALLNTSLTFQRVLAQHST